jgi:hypothetical protein
MKDNVRTTVGGIFLVVWTMGSLLIVNDDLCKKRTDAINVNTDTTLTQLIYYPKGQNHAQDE